MCVCVHFYRRRLLSTCMQKARAPRVSSFASVCLAGLWLNLAMLVPRFQLFRPALSANSPSRATVFGLQCLRNQCSPTSHAHAHGLYHNLRRRRLLLHASSPKPAPLQPSLAWVCSENGQEEGIAGVRGGGLHGLLRSGVLHARLREPPEPRHPTGAAAPQAACSHGRATWCALRQAPKAGQH